MAKPITDRMAELTARKKKLEADLAALASKAKQAERKRDTRRKIVVGGAILAAVDKDPALMQTVKRVLAAYVGRPQDREVIADLLPPVSPAPVAANASALSVEADDAPMAATG
jgi:hypothetical protein